MKNPVSLAEIALELKVNKSRLAYYVQVGLIKKSGHVGKTLIFDKDKTIERFNKIQGYKTQGKTLKDIKKII